MTSELWDIYDENMEKTGDTFSEGTSLPHGQYGYIVHIIIRNKSNRYLIQQRSLSKKWYPGQWDATCGRVQAGESVLEGAVREVWEELGILTSAEQYRLLYHSIYKNSCLLDIFLLEADFTENDCKLDKNEVEQIKLVAYDEMLSLLRTSKDEEYLSALYKIR